MLIYEADASWCVYCVPTVILCNGRNIHKEEKVKTGQFVSFSGCNKLTPQEFSISNERYNFWKILKGLDEKMNLFCRID